MKFWCKHEYEFIGALSRHYVWLCASCGDKMALRVSPKQFDHADRAALDAIKLPEHMPQLCGEEQQ